MDYERKYDKEPSVMKPRRNIHKLVPEFESKDGVSLYYFQYEQFFIQGMKSDITLGGQALVQRFVWRLDVENRYVLVFKEYITYTEIMDVEKFISYHDGERRKVY